MFVDVVSQENMHDYLESLLYAMPEWDALLTEYYTAHDTVMRQQGAHSVPMFMRQPSDIGAAHQAALLGIAQSLAEAHHAHFDDVILARAQEAARRMQEATRVAEEAARAQAAAATAAAPQEPRKDPPDDDDEVPLDDDEDEGPIVQEEEEEEEEKQLPALGNWHSPYWTRGNVPTPVDLAKQRQSSLEAFLPYAGTDIFSKTLENPQRIKLVIDNLTLGQTRPLNWPLGGVSSNPLHAGNVANQGLMEMAPLNTTPVYYEGGSLTQGALVSGSVKADVMAAWNFS